MAKSVQGKIANQLVYVLIGLLILGLAGFGIGSFTSSVSAIGSVGDEEITVDDYYQQLQTEIDSFARFTGQRVMASQGIQLGMGQRALEALVLQAALDNEARLVGVSVGDQTIIAELAAMPQFRGADGSFNRDAYEFTLERSGMTATEFDQEIRNAQARNLFETAIGGGIPPSGVYTDRLLGYFFTTRDVTWAPVTEELLEGDRPVPTEQDLRRYHEENEPEFTRPEIRHVTAAWITPEMLADPALVAEARVRELYDERSDRFSQPERRDIERLVFPDRQSAEAAKRKLDEGSVSFEELAAELGVLMSDISLGLVMRGDLPDEAADAVFGSESAGIIGPVASSLGPALFRINAILKSRSVSFAAARQELAEEIAREDAQSEIADSITALEDLIAGGATVEELAAESALVIDTIALGEDDSDGLATFEDFQIAVNTAEEGDFPELSELPGGGLFAFRLDRKEPSELRPFETVRNLVTEAWLRQNLAQRLEEKAGQLSVRLESGSDFAALGLSPSEETGLDRNGFVSGAPDGLAAGAFSVGVRQAAVFGGGTKWGVLRVNSESPPDPDNEDTARTISALNGQLTAGIGRDAVALYSDHLRRESGLQLNLEVIDAIHAQLP